MAKITIPNVTSGFTTQTALNTNFDTIEDHLNNKVLYRDNPTGEPNQMENTLDMNSNRVINLPAPVSSHEAARLADVSAALSGTPNASLVTAEDGSSGSLWTTVQGFINRIKASTGAITVGADDGSSGSIFTTVQGFIDKILSSTGAAIVGFIQAGAGAVAENLQTASRRVIYAEQFGAATGNSAAVNTTAIQAACDSFDASGGNVVIRRGISWTPASLTWVAKVHIIDESISDTQRYILNGGNAGGAVNELVVESGFHPGIVLDVYNTRTLDTLGAGQVYSNRASYIWRVNGTGKWQIANDINADGTDHLTFYRLNTSFQNLTFTRDGKNIFGQMASGGLWTADYVNNLRGASVCFENSSGNLSWIWRLNDNSKRKIWTFDTTNDRIELANTANNKFIFGIDDNGQLKRPLGAAIASAATIAPAGPIVHITGTAAVVTITPPYTSWSGSITLIPDGAFTTTTAGNIALASTAVPNRALIMTYDNVTAKWYPSY